MYINLNIPQAFRQINQADFEAWLMSTSAPDFVKANPRMVETKDEIRSRHGNELIGVVMNDNRCLVNPKFLV